MRYLFLILSCCLVLSAAQERDINALIDDIVNATPETRYEKMNAFKLRMRELNQVQRTEALETLRAKAYPGLNAGKMATAPLGKASGDAGRQQLQIQQQQMLQQQEKQLQTQQPQQQPKMR